MTVPKIKIGSDTFIEPSTLAVAADISVAVATALREYRQALRVYEAAYPEGERGNVRQQEAQRRWKESIATLVARGLSVNEIHEAIGEPKYLTNAMAREIIAASKANVEARQRQLVDALLAERARIEYAADSGRPGAEVVLEVMKETSK